MDTLASAIKSSAFSGKWLWSAVLLAALFSGLLAFIHLEHRQLIQQANAELDNIRQAQVDLTEGFLHVSLAKDNELPFRRDQGLALIRQSLAYLELMMESAALDNNTFRQHISTFLNELTNWNEYAASTGLSATRLRIAFSQLEHEIKKLDTQKWSDLRALSAHLDSEFQWVLGLVALSLALFTVIAFRLDKSAKLSAFKLLEKEMLLRRTQEVARLGGWQFDVATNTIEWTDEVYKIFGVSLDFDPNNLEKYNDFYASEDRVIQKAALKEAVEQGTAYDLELQLTESGERQRWVRAIGQPVLEGNKVVRVLGCIVEITRQKSAEARIKRLTRLYQALSETNQAIIRMDNENELFPLVCRCAVVFGGLKTAWVGQLDTSSSRILPVAAYGDGLRYLDSLTISDDDAAPGGQNPTGVALRENRPIIINDYLNDTMTRPWLERARKFAWGAAAAFPIQRNGKAYAVLTVFDAQKNAFDNEAITLLKEMACDISFALDNFDREAQRKFLAQNLDKAYLRLAHIIDVNPAILYSLELQPHEQGGFVIDFLSETVQRKTGYSTEEWFTPGFWFNHVHPDDQPAAFQAQNHLLEYGTLKHQYRFLFADGKYRWIEDQLLLYRDKTANHSEIVGAWLDITELKQSEEKLQHQLKELQRWFAVTLDREERVGQLKTEINELRARLGEPPRYTGSGTLPDNENTWHAE